MKTSVTALIQSTNQYSPNRSNGQDSGFVDYDMSDSDMDCQNDIEDMCRIATLAEHFGLTSFRTYQKKKWFINA